jgi:hypothetical protein
MPGEDERRCIDSTPRAERCSDVPEPPEQSQVSRHGRHRLSAKKFPIAFVVGCALTVGIGCLIALTPRTKDVTPLCREIASLQLAENETKAFILNDGSRAVVTVTSADASGGAGTLIVGEQVYSVRFSKGVLQDWHDFRVTMIDTTMLSTRPALILVASDCSKRLKKPK